MSPANDNHPKYIGPHIQSREMAERLMARWFFTGVPCARGHLSPRQTRDGKCAVCVWLSWEAVRRRKGKKPFQPNVAKAIAAANGERYFSGAPCPKGHDGTRWTHNGACVECSYAASLAFHRSDVGIEYSRKWRAENPDKVGEYNRNTKARRKLAEGSHTAAEIDDLLRRQKYKCAECGVSVRKKGQRHVDHVMPLALGGSNWISNLQILCPTCNMSKGAKHPLDWAKAKGRLV